MNGLLAKDPFRVYVQLQGSNFTMEDTARTEIERTIAIFQGRNNESPE